QKCMGYPGTDRILAEGSDPGRRTRPDRWFYSRSARAMKLRGSRVRPLVSRARKICPWITDSDVSTLRSWADPEIIGAGLMAEMIEHDILENGKPRPIFDALCKLRRTQSTYARELGLSPAARSAEGARR